MSKEAQPTRTLSPSEEGFQRLLIRAKRDESRPGEGWTRAGLNTAILFGSTVVDLAESHLADKVIRKGFEEKLKQAREKSLEAAQRTQGVQFAKEFVEEWGSDASYAAIMNGWVRLMTGVDGANYVSETSAFLADWANIISQVFFDDKYYPKRFHIKGDEVERTKVLNIKKAYKSMDFINPVNVEAAIRLLEEAPVVGNGFVWLHEKADKTLESTLGRIGGNVGGKGILGYHIGRNVKKLA